jgi:hypothetical protein
MDESMMLEKINSSIPNFIDKLNIQCLSSNLIFTIYNAILACEKYNLYDLNIMLQKFKFLLGYLQNKRGKTKIRTLLDKIDSLCNFIITKIIILYYNETIENPYKDNSYKITKDDIKEVIILHEQISIFLEQFNLQGYKLVELCEIINVFIKPIIFHATKQLNII